MAIPTALFTGYTFDATPGSEAITIPLSSLPVLSAAEANATTGDGREVLRAIIEAAIASIEAMSAEDKPKFMTANRGNIVGVSPGVMRRSYTLTFEELVTAAATTLRPEPA